jgi:hypothetical protein
MSESTPRRIAFGIAGFSSLILGLYIGYWYLGFVKEEIGSFLSLSHLYSIWFILTTLIIVCFSSVLIFIIVSNFLNISYNSLTIAIIDKSPTRGWMIYAGKGKTVIYGLLLTISLFSFGSMLYSTYAQWDPHIGEFVNRDGFYMSLDKLEATDQLDNNYVCNSLDAGVGWKFITVDYYIKSKNETRTISMLAGQLTDENGISYSNYYNECLSKEEYYYRQEIPDYKFGKLVYRLPLNAVPGKLNLMLNSTQVEISLHKRQFL